MKSTPELEAVFSYTQSQNIHIDKEEFKFQVETHTNFPSLLAFTDALSFFDIPNIAIKLPFDETENLENSFVALLKNENQLSSLYHVTKDRDFYFLKENNKVKKLTKEELKKQWQEIVLLIEAPKKYIIKSNYKTNKYTFIALFTVIFVAFVYYFSNSLSFVLFSILSIFGLILSVEALKTELGIESKISQSFCNTIPNADCGQVINSPKIKWLQKIKISDISFWFFASQLLAIFVFLIAQLSSQFFSIMIIGLASSLPLTLYSIYFQYKIEKKWCPICLLIIGNVYIEFAFLLFFNTSIQLNVHSLVLFSFILSIIAGFVYLLKPIFIEKKNVNEKYVKQLRFSRNYEIFKNTLIKTETQFFEKEYIIIGNRESKHRISIITNPLCGYCKDSHHIMDKIFFRFKNDIAISVRFNYDKNSSIKELYLRLGEIYESNGDNDFMFALKNWFENKNLDNWLNKFGNYENTKGIEKKLIEIANENKEKELNFTPNIFLNQYNYPSQYERENLDYFIADWLEDEEL